MDSTKTQKIKRVRSTSYPATNLEKAIKNVQTIKNNLGKGPFSRDSAAKALGYRGISGKSATVVAALVHYGLLKRKADTYMVSELSDEILTYRDELEKQSAVVKAVSHPTLYGSLLKAYEGRSLPAMLEHILVRDYGIRENVAPGVAKDFKHSMEYAGLLTNGVLNQSTSENASSATNEAEAREDSILPSHPQPTSGGPKLSGLTGMQHIPIFDGVVLSYRGDLAFHLFTLPKFATALQDLKTALQELDENRTDPHDGQQGQQSELV